ncbi:alpha/beta hydrolase [Agilicoccus flavus]|uniref:alpha/beta hydrolase n=1 Tax=Agilicoccus flavus TaxID=2775968 RepID=UPI001CF62A59|nr:alpha/beta hydrolase [Agilicoccus flavus]
MRKPLKIALILGLSLAVLTATGLGVVVVKPQVAVGALQTALYRDGAEINPKHPLHPPQERVRDNGILYRNDIRFGDTFPNSFLDISYATADKTVPRPTIIYWHGGGFFGGDKAMGDPMAASDDSNKLFDELILEGYNLVNINYVLVPDHHFPDPVLQMNEAVNYLVAHAEELHLDRTT